MKATLDRIEDGVAVLLVRNDETVKFDFPAKLLPEGCKEGDVLDIAISRDMVATSEARERMTNLIEKLKNKNNK